LDTLYRNQSIASKCAKGLTFDATTPPASPLCLIGGGDNNYVNTIKVGNEILLLTDTNIMLRMDIDTLAQPGHKHWTNDGDAMHLNAENPNWTKHLPLTGSAHPLKRPGTNHFVGITSDATFIPWQKSYIDLLTYDGEVATSQPRRKIGSTLPLDHVPFLHSFGVTPNYVVIPLGLGLGFNPKSAEMGHVMGSMLFQWQGIHVVDLKGSAKLFMDMKPFAHVHIINAFENGTGITVDLGAYDNAPFANTGATNIHMTLNKTIRDANPVRATPRRYHLHMSGPLAGKTTVMNFAKVPNSHSDFFKVNSRYSGKPYCHYYATQWWHDGASYASMAIMKHDVCKDQVTFWKRPNVYPGEPMFVASEKATVEDDGLVVFAAIDGVKRVSMFVTLDAKTMTEINGTDVHLASHIPFTAHGEFFPISMNGNVTFV